MNGLTVEFLIPTLEASAQILERVCSPEICFCQIAGLKVQGYYEDVLAHYIDGRVHWRYIDMAVHIKGGTLIWVLGLDVTRF